MPPRRILIVEDDEAIRNLVRVAATRWGYETVSCSGAEEAIAKLRESTAYDVVVLDLMMPVTSGYDVILHIRDNALSIPVIVITAIVRGLEIDRLDPKVVRAVVRKPFDLDRLSDAIAEACRPVSSSEA